MSTNVANTSRLRIRLLAVMLVTGMVCSAANAAVSLLGVQFVQDNVFPEYACLWHDRNYPPEPCPADTPGSHAHVFIKNDGASSITISDVTLAGYSLGTVIKYRLYSDDKPAHSIYHYWNYPPQDIIDAGEPVWFKGDPKTIPAGGVGQAIIRLRWVPTTANISVGVVTTGGTINTSIPVNPDQPELASVGFSEDLTKVYLHWRRSGGATPSTIKMDGTNVTSITTTVGDASINFAVSVISLSTPVTEMSYHVFQGYYSDGATASAGLRTRAQPMMYGSWCAFPIDDYDYEAAADWIDTCADRGINALIMQSSGGLTDYLATGAGQQHAAEKGYRFVIDYYGKFSCYNPMMWFLDDEPDIEENTIMNNFCRDDKLYIPCNHDPTGIKAMHFISEGETLRSQSNSPTTINMDGTYKPRNYYAYGQAVDSLMIDSYYQKRVMDSYYYYPDTQPLYAKATVIYATSLAGTRASEPNPFNILLFSCEANPSCCDPWPFAPPATKRTEVYYALAGGAKGIGYWWFKPGNPSNGLGDQADPNAQALWKEIGLLGAEIKTVRQLLATACPVNLNVQGSTDVWVRTLAVNTNTLILIVVNDNLYNDDNGVHYTPVSNATVTIPLPSWLTSPTAFDVDAGGIGDIASQLNGNQLQLNLGTLDVTRMIIVTSDTQLRSSIEQRYEQQVGPGVCNFAPDVCTQSVPPTITQHPQPSTICTGGAATFTVGAVGTDPLAYQWQKNQVNLSNGGHYSGVTTSTLQISNADTVDAANYRCVVTNDYGSATSNQAALTVLACNPNCLQNLGFENGFTGGIGTGWTKFIKSGTEGEDLSFSDETVEHHSGSHCQEIYSHDNLHDGGVYQRFMSTPGETYTLKAWFKVYSPEASGVAEGLLGLDPTGGTDPNSGNIIWVSKPYEYWSQKVWPVTAQADYITVYLRGHSTKDPSKNKTAYVWIDDVELAPGAPTDSTPEAVGANGVQWKWIDLASETGYRVRDGGGADKSGLLPADTTQWTETTGIAPNTQYTRYIHAINDCGESDPSNGQTMRTLSIPPEAGSITPSNNEPNVDEEVIWTAVSGFGAGAVQYYRYAWDQSPTYSWTGSEPQWSSGTISTVPTALGTWYLHVEGYNADNVANGTYDYGVNAGGMATVPADLDLDGDVDLTDFGTFQACLSISGQIPPGCDACNLNGDDAVDITDLGIFLQCLSGKGIPADPNCAD